jgi:uncharacterized membrane protein AbrB (regulator of aidB expression)
MRQRPRDPQPPETDSKKEIAMNAFVSTLYRDLSCAAAALLISVIVGASFVQSTATAPAALATVAQIASASA